MARRSETQLPTPPQPLAARYLDLLAEEGYRPSHEPDGGPQSTITFKAEGRTYLLFLDEEDPGFLHLGMGFSLPEELSIPWALDRANAVNVDLKVVKATVHPEDRDVRFHAELFLPGGPSTAVIDRAIAQLRFAAKSFFAAEHRPEVHRLDA